MGKLVTFTWRIYHTLLKYLSYVLKVHISIFLKYWTHETFFTFTWIICTLHNMQLKYLIWLLHARIEKLKKIHLKILRIYLKKLIYKFNKVTWYMHNCTYPETSKNKEPRNKKYPSTCVYCLTSGNMLVSAVVIITPIGTCCKSQPFLIFLKGTVSREKVNGLRAASDLRNRSKYLFWFCIRKAYPRMQVNLCLIAPDTRTHIRWDIVAPRMISQTYLFAELATRTFFSFEKATT